MSFLIALLGTIGLVLMFIAGIEFNEGGISDAGVYIAASLMQFGVLIWNET